MTLELGKVNTLNGLECVLIADEVAPESRYEDGVALCQTPLGSHFVREKAIDAARQDHPGLPVYGLWQVLSDNNVLDENVLVQVFSEGERYGQYLLKLADGYETGRFVGNRIPSHPDVNPADALRIEPPEAQLTAPEDAALTAIERHAILQQIQRKKIYGGVAGAGLAVAILAMLGFLSAWHYQGELDQEQALKNELRSQNTQLMTLQRERSKSWPDNHKLWSRLSILTQMEPRIQIPATAPHMPIEVLLDGNRSERWISALPVERPVLNVDGRYHARVNL